MTYNAEHKPAFARLEKINEGQFLVIIRSITTEDYHELKAFGPNQGREIATMFANRNGYILHRMEGFNQ